MKKSLFSLALLALLLPIASLHASDPRKRQSSLMAGLLTFDPKQLQLSLMAGIGSPKDVDELLQDGVNINMRTHKGRTPLMVAASAGNRPVVELLLERGADIFATDPKGYTATKFALDNKHTDIARLLAQAAVEAHKTASDADAANTYSEDSGSESTIPYAYSDADTYSSSSDLSESSDEDAINLQNNKGRTVLMDALRLNRSFVLKTLLLTNGSNPNLRTKQTGKTALFYAVQKENSEDVGLLLHFHANPLISDAFGQTPLMYAAHSGNTDIMEQLLDDGAIETINAVDHKGITALTRAVDQGHSAAAQLLLEKGARVYPSGQGNITPVYVAHKKRNVALLQILLKYAMEERSPDLEDEIASLL